MVTDVEGSYTVDMLTELRSALIDNCPGIVYNS